MKFRLYLSLFASALCTQTVIPSDYYSFYYRYTPKKTSAELQKYIETAGTKAREKKWAAYEGTPDLTNHALYFLAGTTAAHLAFPHIGTAKMLYGLSLMTPELVLRNLTNTYKYYSINAPYGFEEQLKKLGELIDTEKTTFIGDKQYFLAKNFNDIENTGYRAVSSSCPAAAPAELLAADFNVIKNQYEIYLMPDSENLVAMFETITKTLKDKSIAFIAIRPTPILTNNVKQILPRIVIVLRKNSDKKVVDDILRKIYLATSTMNDLKSAGSWPRYSEVVTFNDPHNTPSKLANIVFVGMGNSNFKAFQPAQFERKKFFGISQSGDMAYPIDIPADQKIGPVTIEFPAFKETKNKDS
jgi:hypothetical protein